MNTNTVFTDNYDKNILLNSMMGPNALRIGEELAALLPMKQGLRVLDLGCGTGLTSVLLAKKHGATVFAADLWIPPTDNAERFAKMGIDGTVFPLSLDATKEIPFAENYFDVIFSVDAYQYFGCNGEMLPKLLPFLKKGGHIAVAVPGFNRDFAEGELPDEVRPFWTPEWYFYSKNWWRNLWEKAPGMTLVECGEMPCCGQAWAEWLESPSEYANHDREMMAAGAGKHFALVQMIGRKE